MPSICKARASALPTAVCAATLMALCGAASGQAAEAEAETNYGALHGDPTAGAELHMEKCTGCHGDEIYTREGRRVDNLARIDRQLLLCNQQIGLQLFDDELAHIAAYLNRDYYRFKP